jgi:hypothetical protein
MNDHIKGLLALAFCAPEDSETFAALINQIDQTCNVRGDTTCPMETSRESQPNTTPNSRHISKDTSS